LEIRDEELRTYKIARVCELAAWMGGEGCWNKLCTNGNGTVPFLRFCTNLLLAVTVC